MNDDKIYDALSNLKLLPEEHLKDVSSVIAEMLEESKKDIETDYQQKLEEAYESAMKQIEDNQKESEDGFKEAYGIIQELRNRLDMQRTEFDSFLESQYEEAYKTINEERSKAEKLEVELYEQYETKLNEMKAYLVDKIHEFLEYQGKEIYEQARKDILNDPNMAEKKVVLDKVIEAVSDYVSDEDYAVAVNKTIDENKKTIEELKANAKLLEARNIRLSAENNKLNEAVRNQEKVIKEHVNVVNKTNEKERQKLAENVQGRGNVVADEKLIAEYDESKATNKSNPDRESKIKAAQYLAGIIDNV